MRSAAGRSGRKVEVNPHRSGKELWEQVRGLPETANAEVIGEGRGIPVNGGRFADEFKAYDVHLYRIR